MRSLWSTLRIGFIACLVVGSLIGLSQIASRFSTSTPVVEVKEEGPPGEFKSIDWRVLRELNLENGRASDKLRALDGKKVQIPGFLVPLEDNQEQVSEFLLVPSPQACIHVPPPPPNQMIYVKMREPIGFQWGYRAFWVMGILSLKSVDSPYGAVSFEMLGDRVKPFNSLK